jgi:hypothetical protein
MRDMTVLKTGILFTLSVSLVLSQAPTMTVEGAEGKSVVLTAADISNLPQKTFSATDHGKTDNFEGVLLTDVLAKVETPTGEKYHGTAASYFVVVEASDGYRAVFAWAELDPSFNNRPVYVATKRDGKPLSAKEGPYETVVTGEKRNARWVHGVVAVRIKRAN